MERALIEQYIGDLRAALAALRPDTLDVAVAIAQLPDMIRGFGPVKDANRVKAEEQRRVLLPRLDRRPAAGGGGLKSRRGGPPTVRMRPTRRLQTTVSAGIMGDAKAFC